MNAERVRDGMLDVAKLALITITVPATWQVAGAWVGYGYAPVVRAIVQVAATAALDLLWLASWRALDSKEDAPLADKMFELASTVFLFVLVMVIGALHGEGLAGLTFRLVAGVGITRSAWTSFSTLVQSRRHAIERETGMSGIDARSRAAALRRPGVKRAYVQAHKQMLLAELEHRTMLHSERSGKQFAAELDALDRHEDAIRLQVLQRHAAELHIQQDGHAIVPLDGGYALTCPHSDSGFMSNEDGIVVKTTAADWSKAKGGHMRTCHTNGKVMLNA